MAPATDNSMQVLPEESNRKFKVIAFAVDLTGKKLIDEICHISACHQNGAAVFDQFIMTHRDISRSSIRSHGIRIFTMLGKYRVLKDTNTMKSIHTKSEYSALNDFIHWLQEQKGPSNEGILLAYHDSGVDRVTPFLLEALERYKLTDEFFNTVTGFVNCANLASAHPEIKGKSLALRSLARRLLGDEKELLALEKENNTDNKKDDYTTATDSEDAGSKMDKKDSQLKKKSRRLSREKSRDNKEREKLTLIHSAKFRALTTCKLLQKLAPETEEALEDELVKFASNKDDELKTMEKQRMLANKVRSLRPIFVGQIRTSPKDRSKAVLLRRYLIEAQMDYDTLKSTFELEGADGIVKIVEETSAKKKKQHQDELVELIVNHMKSLSMKKDINSNEVKPTDNNKGGAGDHCDTGSSSTESDTEEFEEAHGGDN